MLLGCCRLLSDGWGAAAHPLTVAGLSGRNVVLHLFNQSVYQKGPYPASPIDPFSWRVQKVNLCTSLRPEQLSSNLRSHARSVGHAECALAIFLARLLIPIVFQYSSFAFFVSS